MVQSLWDHFLSSANTSNYNISSCSKPTINSLDQGNVRVKVKVASNLNTDNISLVKLFLKFKITKII